MDVRIRVVVLSLVLIALGTTPVMAQAEEGSAATPAVIARGDSVYHGPGNCYACHGAKAEGLVGPSLVDAEWIHSKGTYEDILAQVNQGITKEQSKSGMPMPARGGSAISEEDAKAVAAYVHSLSKKQGS